MISLPPIGTVRNTHRTFDDHRGTRARRLVEYEEVGARINVEIPDEDYRCFIQPYENKQRFEALKASSKKAG